MTDERENPIRAEKRRKLHEFKKLGLDPFPHEFKRSAVISLIHQEFENLKDGEESKQNKFMLAGRLMTRRDMGKAAFFNFQDQSENVQAYLRLQDLPESARVVFAHLDIGDIIGVEGYPFRTKKGELSIHVENLFMLCKTLEPLPEKYHGLADIEIKYRHRHLDLIMDPDVRKVFETRSKIIREVRNFLDHRGFLEVETPALQPIYGGAAAHPFSTHHKALDMKLFLKISPELYLKRLIVGGFEKVYEIGKNFRNEGIDRTHNPEFTMLEWYEAYTDYNDQMKQFEELVSTVAQKICGSTKIIYQDREIDLTPPWRRLTVRDGVKEYGGFDPYELNSSQLSEKLKSLEIDVQPNPSHGSMVMLAFEHLVEKHLWDPTLITDFPLEVSPLTKSHRTEKRLVERFEPMIANMEIGNAYTELNDPEDQRSRMQEQEAQRMVDLEAQPMDKDFLHAIDTGMPPTGGVGLGIERLVMLLTNQNSIRDILFFPTMRIKS